MIYPDIFSANTSLKIMGIFADIMEKSASIRQFCRMKIRSKSGRNL